MIFNKKVIHHIKSMRLFYNIEKPSLNSLQTVTDDGFILIILFS